MGLKAVISLRKQTVTAGIIVKLTLTLCLQEFFFLPPCNSTGWVNPMKPVKNMFVLYFSVSKVILILFLRPLKCFALRDYFHGN